MMGEFGKQPLYLYLDESGNFDFSERGTDYFIMTGIVMKRPFKCAESLLSYKYDCMEHGARIEKFHACEDSNRVRGGVLERIARTCGGYSAYSATVRKASLPADMRNASDVYALVFEYVVSEVYIREVDPTVSKAIVITDSLPKEARRKQVEKPLKSFMRSWFQDRGVPYELFHAKSESDPNLQIADYLCWAVQRNETQGKDWPFSKVEGMFKVNRKLLWKDDEDGKPPSS